MLKRSWAAALAIFAPSVALADPPPSTAPAYLSGLSLQPVAIYGADGNIVSNFASGGGAAGSVTAAGTNGSVAQAIQGINGGVNVGVSASAWPLPTGAATAAAQATGNASLSSIDAKMPATVNGRQPVDGSGVTQPVSAASLPLPTGAATSANQTSQTAALGAIGDAAYAGTGNASAIAAQKGIYAATVARQASFVEANSAAIAANGLSPQTARTPGTTYTKFNATAGCTAANANLVVDGSNDGFASYVTVAITAVAANSRNSGSAGSTITAPVNFTAYRAYVANGATANTCSVVSSFTVN